MFKTLTCIAFVPYVFLVLCVLVFFRLAHFTHHAQTATLTFWLEKLENLAQHDSDLGDSTRGVLGGDNSKATCVTKARQGCRSQHAVTTSFAAFLCFMLRCVDWESLSSDVLAKMQLVRGRQGVRSLTGVAESVSLVIRAVNVKITLADTFGDLWTLQFLWLGSLCGVRAMHVTSCGHPCALGACATFTAAAAKKLARRHMCGPMRKCLAPPSGVTIPCAIRALCWRSG